MACGCVCIYEDSRYCSRIGGRIAKKVQVIMDAVSYNMAADTIERLSTAGAHEHGKIWPERGAMATPKSQPSPLLCTEGWEACEISSTRCGSPLVQDRVGTTRRIISQLVHVDRHVVGAVQSR